MIENLMKDIITNMTEKEQEQLLILCLNNKKICKHIDKNYKRRVKYDKKDN